jgi:hypothetical protein
MNKQVAKVKQNATEFQHDNTLWTVRPNRNKTVWTLYKRFRGKVTYRVLSDVDANVPVGVQRQKAS